MPRSVLLRLCDIRDAIAGIRTLVSGAGFSGYEKSWGMQRAVERGLEIISEASRHIPPGLKDLAPNIPWRQISAIGNLLRHEYQRVEAAVTWNIVEDNLGPLAVAVDELIAEVERDGRG